MNDENLSNARSELYKIVCELLTISFKLKKLNNDDKSISHKFGCFTPNLFK